MVSKATQPARKTTTVKQGVAKAGVPRPRAKRAAASAAPVSAPKRPVRRRPLIARVRKADGRPLSFSERLSVAMHREFGHPGPVCHGCRMNASRLAALGSAPSPISI